MKRTDGVELWDGWISGEEPPDTRSSYFRHRGRGEAFDWMADIFIELVYGEYRDMWE